MTDRSPKPLPVPELILSIPTAGLVHRIRELTGWGYKRLAVVLRISHEAVERAVKFSEDPHFHSPYDTAAAVKLLFEILAQKSGVELSENQLKVEPCFCRGPEGGRDIPVPGQFSFHLAVGRVRYEVRLHALPSGQSKLVRADFHYRLGDLKGAKLAVWLAHYLRADREDRVQVKVDDVAAETGYDAETVVKTRSWLQTERWLVPESEEQPKGARGRFGVRAFKVSFAPVRILCPPGELGPEVPARTKGAAMRYARARKRAGASDRNVAGELIHYRIPPQRGHRLLAESDAEPARPMGPEEERQFFKDIKNLIRKGVKKRRAQ